METTISNAPEMHPSVDKAVGVVLRVKVPSLLQLLEAEPLEHQPLGGVVVADAAGGVGGALLFGQVVGAADDGAGHVAGGQAGPQVGVEADGFAGVAEYFNLYVCGLLLKIGSCRFYY